MDVAADKTIDKSETDKQKQHIIYHLLSTKWICFNFCDALKGKERSPD